MKVRIEVEHRRDYIPGREIDGGNYIYWTKYTWNPDEEGFEVEYETSATFPYCKFCGTFGSGGCCHEEPRIMKLAEVLAALVEHEKEEDNYIFLTAETRETGRF